MKRSLLASFIAIFVMASCLALYLYLVLPRQQPAAEIVVDRSPELVGRGRYLVEHVLLCHDCHSKRDWNYYGGPAVSPLGAGRQCLTRNQKIAGVRKQDQTVPGVLCMRNLTPDNETGIGEWTDGEIIRAMREGISRDGKGLFPIMPYSVYRRISNEDAESVVAYLRTLQPVRAEWIGRGIEFPMGLLSQFWPEPLIRPVAMPDKDNSVQYGAYLASIARCEYCHTTLRRFGRNLAPDRRYAGGVDFEVGGKDVVSSNITFHEDGLKDVSREEFIAKFKAHTERQEVTEEGNTPMNWNAYAGMTEADLGAIYDFLLTRRAVAGP